MSSILQKSRQNLYDPTSKECANVVLYHDDTPVINVEHGTTFGLAKMLYESVGGHGQVIGLRQRQNASTLSCIITQDQTVLTEREYDIILHGGSKSKERTLAATSPRCENQAVNTYITFTPNAQVWWADSYSALMQRSWQEDPNSIRMRTPKDHTSWAEQRHVTGGLASRDDKRQSLLPTRNAVEYAVVDDSSCVSPRDSTSPSTVGAESPGRSNQHSPSQVKQSRKRKWQCFYCKKFFVCRSAYDNHERTHTGEKPFQCSVCGRCFAHEGNLKQHSHIHRDVKPHTCDICGRGFTRSNRLRDHKRSHLENRYELLMHTKVQWTPAQKVSTESRADAAVVSGYEESVTSDENQETS